MPCALCTRCRMREAAGVPAAPRDGYYTVPRKVHRCVREKGLDHCGQVGTSLARKLGEDGDFRDLDTGRVKGADLPGRGGGGACPPGWRSMRKRRTC